MTSMTLVHLQLRLQAACLGLQLIALLRQLALLDLQALQLVCQLCKRCLQLLQQATLLASWLIAELLALA